VEYGICQVSVAPLRGEPADSAEQVSQLLFGEHYKVLEKRRKWLRIRCAHDKYEAWLDAKQYIAIDARYYDQLDKNQRQHVVSDLFGTVKLHNTKNFFPIPFGSVLPVNSKDEFVCNREDYAFEGYSVKLQKRMQRDQLVTNAMMFLESPYQWGGRTAFGIDCSGFSQIIYRLCNVKLPRDAYQQAELGSTLSFVEEAEPGDLAFFDNEEGRITHVGILLQNNFIIHASGKVRLDRIDHQGIYNQETRDYSHKLRLMKQIL